MNQTIDFRGLADFLRSRVRDYMPAWLPGGLLKGKEYCAAAITGGKGDSFRVNIETGLWADFATNEKGGDLISLYAAINSINQAEAARELSEKSGFSYSSTAEPQTESIIMPPPENSRPQSFDKKIEDKFVSPTTVWTYKNSKSRIMFYVARYDVGKKKEFRPWTFTNNGKWINKAWPENRPLYGVELLAAEPTRAVLIVEGEKACDAARKLIGEAYIVVTWANGSKAISKTDFRPLYGRRILLWPDADKPGVEAMTQISGVLYPHCPEIKILDVSAVQQEGWDAADCKWRFQEFVTWAKSVVRFLKPIPVSETPLDTPSAVDPTLEYLSAPVEKSQNQSPDLSQNVASFALWDSLGLETNKSGEPIYNLLNFVRVLTNYKPLKDIIWFDEFHQKYFTRMDSPIAREWGDIDELRLLIYFQSKIGLRRATRELIIQAVSFIAHENVKNEPRDWMNSLLWDRTPRVESFFHDCMGVDQTDYTWAISKNFWVSIAARIFDPGCMAKNMVVLEGAQDDKKSTALNEIGGKWYTEAGKNILNKDFFLIMHGKVIVEVGELSAFKGADKESVKQTISCKTDRFRPPYAKAAADFHRQCIFVGTTNKDDYLDDETGGVRFWPIRVVSIDVERIKREREQLFAEATALYLSGAKWYEVPKEATAREQEFRRAHDEWEPKIEEYISPLGDITVAEIGEKCLKIPIMDLDRSIQMRIGKALTVLGWKRIKVRDNDKTIRKWIRK